MKFALIIPVLLYAFFSAIALAQPVATFKDVQYGPDPVYQSLDAYLAQTDEPSLVLIEIHGGGWDAGEKSSRGMEASSGRVDNYLEAGISVVSINYRLTAEAPWPAQLDDAARAVQFVKSKAKEWNIDPDKVSLIGGSAGAHIAMMLAFSPERAKPDSHDPIERQSTKVRCVIQKAGPADLSVMIRELAKDYLSKDADRGTNGSPLGKVLALVGMEAKDFGSEEFYRRLSEISPINHITKDSPPVFIQHKVPEGVTSGDDPRLKWGIHSPLSGYMLEKELKAKGVPYEMLMTPNLKDENNILTVGNQMKNIAFIRKHCGVSPSNETASLSP
jgi:acetyl esterase